MFEINTNNFNLEFNRDLNVTDKDDLKQIKYLLKYENAFAFIQYMSRIFDKLAYSEKYPKFEYYQEELKQNGVDIKNYNAQTILKVWIETLEYFDLLKLTEPVEWTWRKDNGN